MFLHGYYLVWILLEVYCAAGVEIHENISDINPCSFHDDDTLVDCSAKGLTEMPVFPENSTQKIRVINLSVDNNISFLDIKQEIPYLSALIANFAGIRYINGSSMLEFTPRLQNLYLRGNLLDAIPSPLPTLNRLDLGQNQIQFHKKDFQPFYLSTLEYLYLDDNKISALDDLTKILSSHLVYLNLDMNQITGNLSEVLWPEGLKSLSLANNVITSVPKIADCSKLQRLDLRGNQLTAIDFQSVTMSGRFWQIGLENNPLVCCCHLYKEKQQLAQFGVVLADHPTCHEVTLNNNSVSKIWPIERWSHEFCDDLKTTTTTSSWTSTDSETTVTEEGNTSTQTMDDTSTSFREISWTDFAVSAAVLKLKWRQMEEEMVISWTPVESAVYNLQLLIRQQIGSSNHIFNRVDITKSSFKISSSNITDVQQICILLATSSSKNLSQLIECRMFPPLPVPPTPCLMNTLQQPLSKNVPFIGTAACGFLLILTLTILLIACQWKTKKLSKDIKERDDSRQKPVSVPLSRMFVNKSISMEPLVGAEGSLDTYEMNDYYEGTPSYAGPSYDTEFNDYYETPANFNTGGNSTVMNDYYVERGDPARRSRQLKRTLPRRPTDRKHEDSVSSDNSSYLTLTSRPVIKSMTSGSNGTSDGGYNDYDYVQSDRCPIPKKT